MKLTIIIIGREIELARNVTTASANTNPDITPNVSSIAPKKVFGLAILSPVLN